MPQPRAAFVTALARLAAVTATATLAACAPAPLVPDDAASADAPPADASPADAPTLPPDAGVPTWYEQVAPIVYANCVGCHRAGGIAPFSLLDYADAVRVAPLMKQATTQRTMPPTMVDASGACNTYRDDVRWLTDVQVATIAAWADHGTPAGDPANAPQPPAPPAGLSHVDARADIGASYTPSTAAGPDEYRCFVVDPGVPTDRFITGYNVVPGDQRVVHHVIVYSLPTAQAQTQAETLDARDPAVPGYECFGGPGTTGSVPLALWAPGVPPTQFPADTGLRITGGRKVVLQIHYNTLNGAFPDRTAIELQLADSVRSEARLISVRDGQLDLPPRMSLVESSATVTATSMGLPTGTRGLVYGIAPHMHTLGRTMNVQLMRAGGGSGAPACMVTVPAWNFHWQRMYFYSAPLMLAGADSLRITCGFDTTSRTDTVHWGESTQDEMCLSYLYVTAAP